MVLRVYDLWSRVCGLGCKVAGLVFGVLVLGLGVGVKGRRPQAL